MALPQIATEWRPAPKEFATMTGLHQWAIGHAKAQHFGRAKECCAQFIIAFDNGTALQIVCPWSDDTEKNITIGFLRMMLEADQSAVRYAFMTEAWMSTSSDGKMPHVMPSKDPKRVEILQVITRDRAGASDLAMFVIDERTRKLTQHDTSGFSSMGGLMGDLFTRETKH